MEVVKKAQAGGGVAVKIEHAVYQSAKMFGRHFEEKDEIYSHITRASIDILKVGDDLLRRWLILNYLVVYVQSGCIYRGVASHQESETCEFE